MGYFEKHHFLDIQCFVKFGQLLETFGLLFIATSGHTGDEITDVPVFKGRIYDALSCSFFGLGNKVLLLLRK